MGQIYITPSYTGLHVIRRTNYPTAMTIEPNTHSALESAIAASFTAEDRFLRSRLILARDNYLKSGNIQNARSLTKVLTYSDETITRLARLTGYLNSSPTKVF